jgi:hypothetical protein
MHGGLPTSVLPTKPLSRSNDPTIATGQKAQAAFHTRSLLALTALLQAGADLGPMPWRIYELSSGLTEEVIVLRLIGLLDAAIVKINRRLAVKAWALAGSLLTIIVALTLTLASI